MRDERFIYVYCIATPDAATAARDLEGIEDGLAPFTIAAAGLAAVASEVPAAGYDEAVLKERLKDIDWAGRKGLRHEAVVETSTLAGATIPLRFCTLFGSRERVIELLERHAARLRTILDDLEGKAEWGLRAYLDRARFEAALAAAAQDPAPGAGGGRAYLQAKKAALDARGRADRSLAEALAQTFAAHQEVAARAVVQPVQPVPEAGATLVLKAAFLVRMADRARLETAAAAERSRLAPLGIELRLTGPWPPYAFVPALEAAEAEDGLPAAEVRS